MSLSALLSYALALCFMSVGAVSGTLAVDRLNKWRWRGGTVNLFAGIFALIVMSVMIASAIKVCIS